MASTDNELSEVLLGAMADPRFEQILSMLKEKKDSGELDTSNIASVVSAISPEIQKNLGDAEDTAGRAPDVKNGIIQKAEGVQNAEMLSKIPELMKLIGPLMGSDKKKSAMEAENETEKGASGGANLTKSQKTRSETEKHRRLLSALTPYLADEKKEAVKNILKISEVTDIFEGLLGGGK